MAKNLLKLKQIFRRTDGRCHICHRKLNFKHHGKRGFSGAWHIEHSVPRANGGTDRLNNLYPACIDCNHAKGVLSTRSARGMCGKTRAPYSRAKKDAIRESNVGTGVVIGTIIGSVGGPWGMLIGAAIGGMIGNENPPTV